MKKPFLAVCVCFYSAFSFAESDFALTWDFLGGIEIGSTAYTKLYLDIDATARHYTADGTLQTASGIRSPVTGTCFDTAFNGVFCSLTMSQYNLGLDISSNANGNLGVRNSQGQTVVQAAVIFMGFE